MARQRRLPPALVAAVLAAVSVALAVASSVAAFPTVGTSPLVVVAMLVCVAVLTRSAVGLAPGWVAWRSALAALALLAAAYPGAWAVAALASQQAPGSRLAWATAVLAGTAHLPVLAAFSLVPLLAVHYLGRGSSPWPAVVVVVLGGLAALTLTLFLDDLDPFDAEALVESAAGVRFGAAVNLAFLATVLLGPVVALLAAWRAEAQAARRLALVAVSALTGAALVMVCGAVAALADAGAVATVVGMFGSLAVVGAGTTRALATPGAPAAPVDDDRASPAPGADPPGVSRLTTARPDVLTPREAEVLQLLAAGLSNAGIAARLVLSERTVDAHLRSVFAKLDLPDGPLQNPRVHAAMRWAEQAGDDVRAG